LRYRGISQQQDNYISVQFYSQQLFLSIPQATIVLPEQP